MPFKIATNYNISKNKHIKYVRCAQHSLSTRHMLIHEILVTGSQGSCYTPQVRIFRLGEAEHLSLGHSQKVGRVGKPDSRTYC